MPVRPLDPLAALLSDRSVANPVRSLDLELDGPAAVDLERLLTATWERLGTVEAEARRRIEQADGALARVHVEVVIGVRSRR